MTVPPGVLNGAHADSRWKTCSVLDVAEFTNGKPLERYVSESGNHWLITLDSVNIDGNLKRLHRRVSVNDQSLEAGDLVSVLSDLAHGNLLGLTALIPDGSVYVLNQRMARLRVKRGFDSRFIRRQINAAQRHFRSSGQGTSQRHIYKRDFANLLIGIPTLPQQCAIADALDDVNALIVTLEQVIAKEQAIMHGMMQQLLTGSVRLPGFVGRWDTAELGDHFDITSSKRVFRKDWRTTGVPFYRARELAALGATGRVENELFIDRALYEEYKHSYGAPTAGDFLVTGVGTLGKTYVVRPGDEFYFKDGNIIWFKASDSVDSDFLSFLYRTPTITRQIEDGSSGTTVGTYTITNAKKTEIPLPSIEEQRGIAVVLRDAEKELHILRKRLIKVTAVKQGMTQGLLTGRTRLLTAEAMS